MSNAAAPRKVVFAALLIASLASAQSTYQGRTAEEWIARFEKSDPAAAEALVAMGPEAVPAILAVEDDTGRGALIPILARMGPQAREALPMLVALAQMSNVWGQGSAVVALGQIGVGDEAVVDALRRIGAKGKGVAEGLAPLLLDEEDAIRHGALRVLARMGRDGANVLARSLQKAKDRSEILEVLVPMDDCPLEVIATLARDAAARAQPGAWDQPSSLLNAMEEGTVSKLGPMLKSSTIEDARDASVALVRVAFRSPAARKLLVSVVDHKDAEIRKRAIGSLDLSMPEEFAKWREALGDPDATVRKAAWETGARSKSASQDLILALWDSRIDAGAGSGDIHSLVARTPDGVAPPRKRAEALLYAARRDFAAYRAHAGDLPAPQFAVRFGAESGNLLARTVANDPEGIAVLVGALEDPEERVRLLVANALGLIGPAAKEAAGPLTEMTSNLEGHDRCAVLIALARIHADPAVVGPMLAEAWKDPKFRPVARTGLLALDRGALPWIEALLFDPQVVGREEAILDLRVLFPVAHEAIELVARGLKDSDPQVRHRAAWVLQIDPRSVPGHSNLQVAPFSSAEETAAVRRLIVSSPTATAALCAHVADPYSTMSEDAAVALAQLAPEAVGALPTLALALRHGNPRVVEPAAQGVVRFGAAGARAVVGLLADRDPLRRVQGAELLGTIGAAAGDVAADLLPLLSDPDAHVRDGAIVAYARIGRPSPDAVPALVRAIEEASGEVLDGALEALAMLGPAAEAAAPTLTAMLDRGDPRIRLLSLTTWCRIDPDGTETLERLRRGVADPDPGLRRAAWDVLLSREGGRAEALGALAEAPKDPDILRRAAAIESLGGVGTDATPHVEAIAAALVRGPLPVRREAARALGRLGGGSLPSQEALLVALSDPDAEVRAEASRAIGLLAGAEAPVPPRLLDLLFDDSEAVRQAAAEASSRHAPLDRDQVHVVLRAEQAGRRRHEGDRATPQMLSLLAHAEGLDAQAAHVGAAGWLEVSGDPSSDVADALVRLGPEGVRAVTSELARRREARRAVGMLLVRFGEAAAPAASILARPGGRGFEPDDGAIAALAAMGPAARSAEPVLWDAFYDRKSIDAAQALVAIGARSEEPMAFLVERARLGGTDAHRALGLLGPRAKGALPVLWNRVRGKGAGQLDERYVAAIAIHRIDPSGEDPLPSMREELLVALRDPKPEWATWHFELGPLLDAVENGDPALRVAAARKLGRGGLWAIDALPTLRSALAHPDPAVQEAVREAIRAIREAK